MTKSRNILRPRAKWTADMLATMRAEYPHKRSRELADTFGLTCSQVYHQAARMGLKKSEQFYNAPQSGRLGNGQGASTRFQKGHQSWNKGLHYQPGGRNKDTRFKKGELHGAAQYNYVPIGSLRISPDGYLEQKMTDDPDMYPARRWTAVHRLVWEAANGPVPAGHIVRFKPGMKTTVPEEISIDKLLMVSKRENMQLNSLHRYPKEIALALQLKGQLVRKINRLEKANANTNQ